MDEVNVIASLRREQKKDAMGCTSVWGHSWKTLRKDYHKGDLKGKIQVCKKCGQRKVKTY